VHQALQVTLGIATAAVVGTIYVIVHEQRRKTKSLRKESRGTDEGSSSSSGDMLSKEGLINLLEQSSDAAYQLIEQTRKMIFAKHEQSGIPLDKVVESFQTNFEQAMQAVVYQIRKNHGVTEEQMTAAMAANQADPAVELAIKTLHEAMNGKAPPQSAQTEEVKRPVRRSKPKRKG